MRKRPIKLRESDIMNIVKRVIRERENIPYPIPDTPGPPQSGGRPNKGGSNICSELPADFPSDEELENNFALQNPEEYAAIEDKYIAGGGRPGDARWVSFFFRMGFPKGLLWDELTYDLPTEC